MNISNNVTKQGAILSPILWATYADPMLQMGIGARMCGLYVGAVMFADDVLLIAPSRNAMQRMLEELERFASEYNITFSTDHVPARSKSKCLYVTGKPAPLLLCGNELPWVDQADHLGCIITSSGDMDQDAKVKRAKFIASSSEIRNIFKSAAPNEIIKALRIYSCSFYGSNLWDLDGEAAQKVFSAWDTAVKLVWGCPQWTRTYLLQSVLYC